MLSVGANVEVSQDAVPLKVDKTAPRAEGKNPTSSVEVKISHRLGISVANVTSHMCGCGNNWFIKEDNEVKTYDIVHFILSQSRCGGPDSSTSTNLTIPGSKTLSRDGIVW